MINKACNLGVLHPALPQGKNSPFPVIQYADDTLLVMQGKDTQLLCLKGTLHTFTESTSLKVNFHKSCLVPINISPSMANHLAIVFGCSVGHFPFTYLGLPLCTTKPQVKDFAPLICRVERRLSASSQFLSYAGRLQLVNSVISSLPTYYMYSLKLPVTVIDIIDKYRKDCLWRGNDLNRKGYNLAAWNIVMKPKDKGGLGVVNLTLQKEGLLLKQLDKFYNKEGSSVGALDLGEILP